MLGANEGAELTLLFLRHQAISATPLGNVGGRESPLPPYHIPFESVKSNFPLLSPSGPAFSHLSIHPIQLSHTLSIRASSPEEQGPLSGARQQVGEAEGQFTCFMTSGPAF